MTSHKQTLYASTLSRPQKVLLLTGIRNFYSEFCTFLYTSCNFSFYIHTYIQYVDTFRLLVQKINILVLCENIITNLYQFLQQRTFCIYSLTDKMVYIILFFFFQPHSILKTTFHVQKGHALPATNPPM